MTHPHRFKPVHVMTLEEIANDPFVITALCVIGFTMGVFLAAWLEDRKK